MKQNTTQLFFFLSITKYLRNYWLFEFPQVINENGGVIVNWRRYNNGC